MAISKHERLKKAIRAAVEAGQVVHRAVVRPDGEIELHFEAAGPGDDFDRVSFERA